MFKFIQSPIPKSTLTPTIYDGSITRSNNHRYSSVDQCYSKPESTLNLSRLQSSRPDKKYLTGQKTDRDNKQRTHSQKKLTLTSAINPNGSYTSSLTQSQNLSLINAKQAYEGFKKNLQLKTTLSKNTPLEKKGKLIATQRTAQQIKFPTSNSQIRIENMQTIRQKENEYQGTTSYVPIQKENSNALIETNSNNYYTSNPQYYSQPQTFQTAPNSPVYRNHTKGLNLQSKQTQNNQFQAIKNNPNPYQDLVNLFSQKLSLLKDQNNTVLMQNCKKIKELQSLLLQNKQLLQEKNQKIRQLQLSLVLKQNNTAKPSINNPINFPQQNSDFIISRINDVQKKVQILSQWSDQQQEKVNQKIDQVNYFMNKFVSAKFHNLKFTLKAFITKTEQRVSSIIDNVNRIDSIVNLNQLQSYENLIKKAKSFASTIQKLVEVKHTEKNYFQDMKTTINTTVESFKHRPSNSTYQHMIESTEINESFWNNLEDLSVQQSKIQQESSFTDDSFSYAPGLKSFQINSNNSSSVNEFALGSFPSFSKSSGDVNTGKESLHSIMCSKSEQDSICIRTLQQIAKYRQGPVTVYLDMSGSLRYKGSESYIFDRKGNILKPSREEVSYCIKNSWILMA